MMEPLSDGELDYLLGLWVVPDAPASLEEKLFPGRFDWRQWLFKRPLFLNHWRRRRRPRKA
jgi:hypothetical protein